MLGWSMKVSLQAMKSGFLDMSVEQINGRSLEEILLGLSFHDNLPLLTLLLVLSLGGWIKVLVLELECIVLEVFERPHSGLKIDWCTLATETRHVI